MSKEEMIKKIHDTIVKMKNETKEGVIKDFMITPLLNLNSCEETGEAAVITLSSKFVYSESVLTRWKEELGASEFRLSISRMQLNITYYIHYNDQK